MGAGASKPANQNVRVQNTKPETASIESLQEPQKLQGCEIFHVIPQENGLQGLNLRVCTPTLFLEVSKDGLRLLRDDTHHAICAHPWGTVHSWTHTPQSFSFRYFDDGKRAILQCSLQIKQSQSLLDSIQTWVDAILKQRKKDALSDVEFEAMLDDLEKVISATNSANGVGAVISSSTPMQSILDIVDRHTQDRFIMACQGRVVLAMIESPFDLLEAAVLLHGRLVDQSNFNCILDMLSTQLDKDNVWHRITSCKKVLSAGGTLHNRLSSKLISSSNSSGGAKPSKPISTSTAVVPSGRPAGHVGDNAGEDGQSPVGEKVGRVQEGLASFKLGNNLVRKASGQDAETSSLSSPRIATSPAG